MPSYVSTASCTVDDWCPTSYTTNYSKSVWKQAPKTLRVQYTASSSSAVLFDDIQLTADGTYKTYNTSDWVSVEPVPVNIDSTGSITYQYIPSYTPASSAPIVFDNNGMYKYSYTMPVNGSDFTVWDQGVTNITYTWGTEETAADRMRNRIRNNLLIKTTARGTLPTQVAPEEIKARATLRDMITERDWRRYSTNGFIMVRGQSKRWYQVFNDGRQIVIFENNKTIGTLCIHTDAKCPPSDHVINMKILIEIDEQEFLKLGNFNRRHLIAA